MAKHELTLGFEGNAKKLRVETPDSEPRPWDLNSQLDLVGKGAPRIDGAQRVSGRAEYTYDVRLPDMLFAAVLRSPLPHATLKRLDLEAARTAPGVHAVLALSKVGDPLKFVGQDIAAVAAESPRMARAALEAIVFELDAKPHVIDTVDASRDGAPLVHAGPVQERRTGGDEPGATQAGQLKGNRRPAAPMRSGDVEKALAEAHTVFEAEYRTQCHTHSALETHGVVVRWDGDDALTCWASTQAIFSVRDELASTLGLDESKVRVITRFMGGGFGAKFGANAPGSRIGVAAAELAKLAGRPVQLMLDRAEEHQVTGNRPDSVHRVRLGADKRGRLTAIHVDALGSGGIATGAGVGRNAFAIYTKCPNRLLESSDVFTHAGPATAFRAPGHPQGAFAIESALDELARTIGTDPIELRLKLDEHPLRLHQMRIGRDRFGWKARRDASRAGRERGDRLRTGVGMALSIWGDFGHPGADVTVTVTRDAKVNVRNGVQDIGTGITTVMAMVVAEVFGLSLEDVHVEIGDSELGMGTGSGGSQTTSTVSPAVRNAAEKVRAELEALARAKLGAKAETTVRFAGRGVEIGGDGGGKKLTFAETCALMKADSISATSSRPPTYGNHPMAFMGGDAYQIAGVQFAAVEVDTWTGEVRCREILAVHDCGRVMNELTLRSQINGGVILGTGYALMEARVMDETSGRMLNPNLETYKALGAVDLPTIDIMLTEVAAGNNSTGAIGIGEPATIPTAAAIANAVGDALGVHPRSLPITPREVFAAMGRSETKAKTPPLTAKPAAASKGGSGR